MQIWTYSGTETNFIPARPWDKTYSFLGLADLIDRFKTEGLNNKIDVLMIVCHGNLNGILLLQPPLTFQNVDANRPLFIRLGSYLTAGTKLIFVGCTAGGGPDGDTLLQGISKILAGCTVIGFNTANMAYGPTAGPIKVYSQNSTRNDEWSEEAKWAMDGFIIRPPLAEVTEFQDHDPIFKNRCGADRCLLGHAMRGQRCDPYKRSARPQWLGKFHGK
jgi:hypothetical protein